MVMIERTKVSTIWYYCITIFYQLTAISVIALSNAIAEAMSNIRESL